MIIRCLYTIIVRGIPQVSIAYPIEINRYEYDQSNKDKPLKKIEEWGIKTQGSNFEALINYPFIDFSSCTTTFVHDIMKFYGVEGGRVCIEETLDHLVRSVSKMDVRYIKLVADVMTAYAKQGKVIPTTRMGLAQLDNSVFRLAAFEEITKNLKDASVHSHRDPLKSTTAAVILGMHIPPGTGSVTAIDMDEQTQSAHKARKMQTPIPPHDDEVMEPEPEPQPAPPPKPNHEARSHRLSTKELMLQ